MTLSGWNSRLARKILWLVSPLLLFTEFTAAQENYSLEFSGNNYLQIPSSPELSGGDGKSITVEAWIRPDSGLAEGSIISKWLDGNDKDWGLLIRNDSLHVTIENARDNWTYTAGAVSPGVWTHVAFSFDGKTHYVNTFVNGNLAGNGTYYEKSMPETSGDIFIGATILTNSFFRGRIDDIRVWNFARTAAEIGMDMYKPLTGAEQGLLAYWRFDEGTGTTTADRTGVGNDAQLLAINGQPLPVWTISGVPFQTPVAIKVLAPNDGEALTAGAATTIRWAAEESIAFVDIELSTDGGSTWSTIIDEVPNNGSYQWSVPDRFSQDCLIRISDAHEKTYFDVSDVPFVITRSIAGMQITVTGDEAFELYVNGSLIGQRAIADSAFTFDAQTLAGRNLIAIKGTKSETYGGIIAQVAIDDSIVLLTDNSWLQNTEEEPDWQNPNFDAYFWWPARDYGKYGIPPWGKNIRGLPDTTAAHWLWGDSQEDLQVFLRGEFNYDPEPKADSLGPQISNFTVVGTTYEAITLFWETDEPAASRVRFGSTDSLDQLSVIDTSKVTRHTFRLGGLLAGMGYYVQALSIDGSGNTGVSNIIAANTEGGLPGDFWLDYPQNPFVIDIAAPVYRSLLFVDDLNGDDLIDYCYRSADAIYAYDHFGGLLWRHTLPGAHETSQEFEDGTRHSAGDVDGDGRVEVILLDGINTVLVYDGTTGALERTITLPMVGSNNIWYHISLVNLRGNGDRDFVAQSRDTSGVNRHLYLNKNLIAWDLENNRELWRVIHDDNDQNGYYDGFWGSAHSSFHAADVDFDGQDEIVGANMIESDGTIVDLGYPRDWLGHTGDFIDHIDAVSIGDLRPELPGLEWVITEEDHTDDTNQWNTSMLSANGIIWRVETDLFEDGPDREPQNIAVGNFDPDRQYAEVWVRSRFSTPEGVQHPWVIDAFGEEFADYAMDEVLPPGFSSHPYGNREGIEEISVVDWEGGSKKYIAAAARHVDGDIGVFDAVTGNAVWTTGRDFEPVRASLTYVADVAGDNREEVIIHDKVRRQLRIYWNDGISLDPIKPRKWQDPLYRRQNQNWNYYSPSSYINEEPADRMPPEIRDLQVETGPGNSVLLTWKTNELALSEVRYGFVGLDDAMVDSILTTEHAIRLSDLTTDSVYIFQANARDRSLNWTFGDTLKFIVSNEEVERPAITGFTPTAAEKNNEVRISGERLATTAAVYFGGNVEAPFIVESDSVVIASVPPGAQTGPLTIVTKGGLFRTQNSIEILPDPELHLVSPNGGENYLWDSLHEITWQTIGRIDTVSIEYSLDGGTSWVEIVTALPNAGTYQWRVPSTSSENAAVRISGRGVRDSSDAAFSIAPFTLEITSPNGGEQLLARGSYPIRWQTVGSIPTVTLEYSLDGGQNWLVIATDIDNAGAYQWTLPAQTSSETLVRVSGRGVDDQSDAAFAIVPGSLTLAAPAGGEKWPALSEQEIRWQTTGVIDSVVLSYSLDNGASWTFITGFIPNVNSYLWRIPAVFSDSARVRITGSGAAAESSAPFTMLLGTLTLATPNGGEEWRATDSYQLNWSATGAIDSLRVDYSLDNGREWHIITGKQPNAGKFSWTLPDTSSDSCLVRIISTRDPLVEDRSDAVFDIYPSIPVVTDSGDGIVPEQFAVHPNYPNPFNPVTTIIYELPEDEDVSIVIYDMLGRRIRTLHEGREKAGGHDVRWHGEDDAGQPVSSGLYFYRVTAGRHVAVRKMLLIR